MPRSRRTALILCSSLLLTAALSGCGLPFPSPPLPAPPEFSETEPNGGSDPPNTITVPLPVRLTGSVASGTDEDNFRIVLPEAGTVRATCPTNVPITIALFEISLGTGTGGGCGSNLALVSDGDLVTVRISGASATSYEVDLRFTPAV